MEKTRAETDCKTFSHKIVIKEFFPILGPQASQSLTLMLPRATKEGERGEVKTRGSTVGDFGSFMTQENNFITPFLSNSPEPRALSSVLCEIRPQATLGQRSSSGGSLMWPTCLRPLINQGYNVTLFKNTQWNSRRAVKSESHEL